MAAMVGTVVVLRLDVTVLWILCLHTTGSEVRSPAFIPAWNISRRQMCTVFSTYGVESDCSLGMLHLISVSSLPCRLQSLWETFCVPGKKAECQWHGEQVHPQEINRPPSYYIRFTRILYRILNRTDLEASEKVYIYIYFFLVFIIYFILLFYFIFFCLCQRLQNDVWWKAVKSRKSLRSENLKYGCSVFCRISPHIFRRQQQGPPKSWYHTPTLHGVATHKTATWIFITLKTSNLA
jgi:hypothetical protein